MLNRMNLQKFAAFKHFSKRWNNLEVFDFFSEKRLNREIHQHASPLWPSSPVDGFDGCLRGGDSSAEMNDFSLIL